MIRCVNRLIEPTAGKIFVQDEDVLEMSMERLREKRRYSMSMVFQHFGLLPNRNVVNNVEFGLEIGGMEKEERRDKAMQAIELVGLQGFEHSMVHELSGGMQQRVGLARALANNPEILLMDEAFSALDPLIRTQMQDELLDLQAKMHKTIMFITHDLDEALKLGDRILILGPGGVTRQIGTPEEILSNPADDYVREFVQNVDKTKVITVGGLMRKTPTVNIDKEGANAATRAMDKNNISTMFVVDSQRRLRGMVRIDDTVKLQKQGKKDLHPVLIENIYTTYANTAISDLLTAAMSSPYPLAVIDEENRLLGIVDRATIIAEVGGEEDEESSPVILSERYDNTKEGESESGEKQESSDKSAESTDEQKLTTEE
jgi:glycine betaine/proline transport system ATP-binding protein